MAKKKHIPIVYAEFFCFTIIQNIFLLLPAKIAYRLAELISDLVFLIDFKHRRRTVSHLLHAGVSANFADAMKLGKTNFRHFAAVMVDVIRFHKDLNSEKKIIDSIDISGSKEAIELFMRKGTATQAIMVTAHYGNWEVGGPGFCCISGRKMLTVMRNFDNPFIEKAFVARRDGYGHSLVSKKGSLKALIRAIKNGNSVCFVSDQHAGGQDGVTVNFFGHPAKAHKSPVLLHLRTGVPICVSVFIRKGAMKYEMRLKEPIIFKEGKTQSIEDIVQLYTKQIEELISENPEQWLWAHRRWLDIDR